MAKDKSYSIAGQAKAMLREAVKDVRGTLHETYFGRPEHAGEPGAPMVPTSQMATDDLTTGPPAFEADAHLAQYQPERDAPRPEAELERD